MASIQPRSFGELLRRYRIAAGLTQEELAEQAGLSSRAIGALETGARRAPRKDTVSLLANALHLIPAEHALLASAARQRLPATTAPQHILTGAPAQALGVKRHESMLVGRRNELLALGRYLAGESPPLYVLAGEPGIGKSRLLEEAARRASEQGWTVLSGGCHRRSGQEPYAPFVGALTRFLSNRSSTQQRLDLQGCAWLVRLLPELAQTAAVPVPSWVLPPEQERRLMFAAVARLLANVASPMGTLLVLDDLHWAGSDALDLLAALLRESAPRPLRIVAAYRDTDVEPRDPLPLLLGDLTRERLATRTSLPLLGRGDARELLSELLTGETGEAGEQDNHLPVIEAVLDRAGGLPLFLVSWSQELRARTVSADSALNIVPWSAAESIRQRVAVLPAVVQDVLAVAAVAGRETPRPVLLAAARASGLDEANILAGLDAVCRARLLAESAGGSYSFTHDLIRETVAADLGGARRAALHRWVAEALEQQPQAGRRGADLAWHFAEGDAPTRALPYALMAGDQAEAVYAYGEAEKHYRTALEVAGELGDQAREAEAHQKLGVLFDNLGRLDEAIAVLELAASGYRTLGDRERLARVTHRLVRAMHRAGRITEGVEHSQALVVFLTSGGADDSSQRDPDLASPCAARALDTLAPAAAALIGSNMASYLATLGRAEEALSVIEAAATRARIAGDVQVQVLVNYMRGNILRDLGRLDDAEQAWRESSMLAREAGSLDFRAIALSNLGLAQVAHGDLAQARMLHVQALEVGIQLGDPYLVAWSRGDLAELAFIGGDWDQARTELEYALEAVRARPPGASRAAGLTYGAGMPLALLVRLDLAEGRTDEGLLALGEVLRLSESSTASGIRPWAQQALAEHDLLAGEPVAARRRLEPVFDADRSRESALPATLAWALLDLGARERALQMVEATVAFARARRLRLALVEALPVLAHVAISAGRREDAAHAADEALALARSMPYPYAEAKALYVYGQMHQAKGETEQARERYEQALAICARLGERLYAEHIERALAELSPKG